MFFYSLSLNERLLHRMTPLDDPYLHDSIVIHVVESPCELRGIDRYSILKLISIIIYIF